MGKLSRQRKRKRLGQHVGRYHYQGDYTSLRNINGFWFAARDLGVIDGDKCIIGQ